MTIKDIYKTVKPSLVKGVTLNDIKEDKDIQGHAWQYAYLMTIVTKPVKNKTRDDIFMGHYTKAMKVLRKSKQ